MKKIISIILLSLFTFSCVEGLNSDQGRKLTAIKSQMPEFYEEEKSEGVALALGLLPGGGSFYTRNYVVGVVDLILWPVSILWDPINGFNGAKEVNYYSSLQKLKLAKKKEIDVLDEKILKGNISQNEYLIEKSRIEKKYDLDYAL